MAQECPAAEILRIGPMLKLIQELVDSPPPQHQADGETIAPKPTLSPRELEIVRHLLLDEKERTIAARLGISAHTVHTHLKHIYWKLGVSCRTELILHIFHQYIACTQQTLPQETAQGPSVRRAAA